jgi:carbamate kinase
MPATYEGMKRRLTGVECVVDPDLASAVLARELRADLFVLLSETDAVYLDDGRPSRNPIRRASPEALASLMFGLRSVSSEVRAACRFAETTGKRAAIGSIAELPMILAGKAGTTISVSEPGITYAAAMSHAATA